MVTLKASMRGVTLLRHFLWRNFIYSSAHTSYLEHPSRTIVNRLKIEAPFGTLIPLKTAHKSMSVPVWAAALKENAVRLPYLPDGHRKKRRGLSRPIAKPANKIMFRFGCCQNVASPGQAEPHDPGRRPSGVVVALVVWQESFVLTLWLHHGAHLQRPQLDRARCSAGLERAHRLTVAQGRQVLTVDAQQDVAWGRKRLATCRLDVQRSIAVSFRVKNHQANPSQYHIPPLDGEVSTSAFD